MGRPSEENAHPHKAGPVAVIHNGIVENYVELRDALANRGHRLNSQTDTEVIAHLIEEKVKAGLTLTKAVLATVRELRGSFSIVVLSETAPGQLVAAKTATPLVVGLGEGENFVVPTSRRCSNIRAAPSCWRTARSRTSPNQVRLMTFAGVPIERQARYIEWDAVAATKGGFRHYLRKEINEQPQAWIDTLRARVTPTRAA